MLRSLSDYREIVGDGVLSEIYKKSLKICKKHIVHINSTYQGGGVAEILPNLVSLMNDAGIDTGWRILHGDSDFFSITKKFHNALQGEKINLSKIKRRLYLENNESFSRFTHIHHDCVIIHDPQPLPLINFQRKHQPWIWRCHIDISHPNQELWDFLKSFILRYDLMIISDNEFYRKDLPIPQRVIYPSIDPLSPKNMEISEELIRKTLRKFKIPTDKPLITQVSRFDKWKDPEGVIEVFQRVKEEIDCRLVLCGSMAADDPEGMQIYNKIMNKPATKKLIQKKDLIVLTAENQILVNTLQRVSSVIIQKSLREGFGLTVTEALWKGTPVVASKVGGIPNQIIHEETGFLLQPKDYAGFARVIVNLLQDPGLCEKIGSRAKEHVRNNFLITRHLIDYLDLLGEIL
ncbi:MAG TPA: glycosyltransferase [Firmicutes bacterium]|jgi:trehalose synthase|nr:glycosyltransferase [Bacillota bacterium]